ncbi:MAG: hypothetical protein G8D60_14890 [gamma proteobacterium symbiont of Phacoides pectinatus]
MSKVTSGLKGLDTILNGGYPAASPTLLKGASGTGKTVFSLGFVHARLCRGEAAVIATCDEAPRRLVGYMDSFGMSGSEHLDAGRLVICDFRPDLSQTVVGEYGLSPILLRIAGAIEQCGAGVLVIDSMQNLLLGLDPEHPRHELLELFDWVRDQGVTTLVTMSEGDAEGGALFEEYAADCIIHLTQHLEHNLMTRYLRVLKLRGSSHGSNNYPFSLTGSGVSLLPITSTRLDYQASIRRVSTGVARIDEMLGGEGYLQGVSLMVSGRAGSGKTILATTMMNQVLEQGGQGVVHLVRGVAGGADAQPAFGGARPATPSGVGAANDPLRTRHRNGAGGAFDLHHGADRAGVSPGAGPRPRLGADGHGLFAPGKDADDPLHLPHQGPGGDPGAERVVVKARGSRTSCQVKEFTITDSGIRIEDPYIGEGALVVGSAKYARIEQEREEAERKRYELTEVEQALAALEAEYQSRRESSDAKFEARRRALERRMDELRRQADQTGSVRDGMRDWRS